MYALSYTYIQSKGRARLSSRTGSCYIKSKSSASATWTTISSLHRHLEMAFFRQLLRKTSMKSDSQSYQKPTLQQARTNGSSEKWPVEPQRVRRNKFWTLSDILVDVLLAGCCCLFLAFALTVRSFDGAQVEDHGTLTANLKKATTYVSRH